MKTKERVNQCGPYKFLLWGSKWELSVKLCWLGEGGLKPFWAFEGVDLGSLVIWGVKPSSYRPHCFGVFSFFFFFYIHQWKETQMSLVTISYKIFCFLLFSINLNNILFNKLMPTCGGGPHTYRLYMEASWKMTPRREGGSYVSHCHLPKSTYKCETSHHSHQIP